MGIKKGQFELSLLDNFNNEITLKNDTFYLKHGTEYKVKIKNNDSKRRINVKILIDKKVIGLFRVGKSDSIIIERPVDREKRLTFYRGDTTEGILSKIETKHGHIEAIIDIEHIPRVVEEQCLYSRSSKSGTGLGRDSQQRFKEAEDIETLEKVVIEANMKLEEDYESCSNKSPTFLKPKTWYEQWCEKMDIEKIKQFNDTIEKKEGEIAYLKYQIKTEQNKANELERKLKTEQNKTIELEKKLRRLENIEPL